MDYVSRNHMLDEWRLLVAVATTMVMINKARVNASFSLVRVHAS